MLKVDLVIIKHHLLLKSNRNLDQITDEILELPSTITDICYNKTKICSAGSDNIPLFENNSIQCLNIKYLFRKKVINL